MLLILSNFFNVISFILKYAADVVNALNLRAEFTICLPS